MNKLLSTKFSLLLILNFFYSSSVFSMSEIPEDSNNYQPADWSKSQSAEIDANIAIENNDLRLLGFAGRNHNIPGVSSSEVQNVIDKCGIRYFEEFGDVVKSNNQLTLMKQARDYALQYNTAILETCSSNK